MGRHHRPIDGRRAARNLSISARAGGHVTFVARVGDAVFGERALRNFEADAIETRFVFRTPDAPSGIALINVDGKGENSISVASGANTRLSAGDIEKADEAFNAVDIVLLQLESPPETVLAAAKKARARGVPVILDPAPARPLGDGLLSLATVLTPNEHEAEFLTGIPVRDESGAREAAVRLRARGVVSVVITLGERGAFASSQEFEGLIPAFKVEPVDTAAADDVFNGALAVALAEKAPMQESLRFASAAAALSVTRPGAQPSAPARSEIGTFLRANTESIAHKATKR
jgi:ribokinase